MRKLHATGYTDYIKEDVPTLYVSGGSGNTDAEEVHLEFVDPEDGYTVMGWFNKDALLAAIAEVSA